MVTRPEAKILVFDVETTGTDKRRDQVIELCMQFGLEPDSDSKVWRIRPQVSIQPGAQAVHGISMEELEEAPSFSECADEIRQAFEEKDVVVGYNVSFDIDMVQAEFARLEQPQVDFSGKEIVDAFRLWQRCEPRSLGDAHRRFVGGDFESAHSAQADVAATGRVLVGMLKSFELDDKSFAEVATICNPERASWVGPSRHVQRNAEGHVILGFGKHSGLSLSEMAKGADAGYLKWIMNQDFPPHVVDICQQALALSPEGFEAWVAKTFGLDSLRDEKAEKKEEASLRGAA